MKKYFAVFISILFMFLNVSPCFALTKLYYVENVNKSSAAKLVENVLTEKEYTIKKKDPYYAVSIDEPINYSIIVLQQDGNNLYYYYNSNNSKKNVNKAIIKYFKTRDLNCEERENEQLLQNFASIAQRTLTGEKKTYSFKDPQPQVQNVQTVNAPKSSTTLKGFVGKTGKGDTLDIYIQNAINTATASVGDAVMGVLQTDWKTADNHVIAQQGSLLEGRIVKAHGAQIGMRNGLVELVFNKLTTPDGKVYDILTKEVEFNVTNEGVVKEKVSSVAVAAVTGAALGALFGLLGGGGASNVWQGAAVGAGIGGGGAAILGAAEKGIDAEIPAYTQVQVVLKNDVDVVINY